MELVLVYLLAAYQIYWLLLKHKNYDANKAKYLLNPKYSEFGFNCITVLIASFWVPFALVATIHRVYKYMFKKG